MKITINETGLTKTRFDGTNITNAINASTKKIACILGLLDADEGDTLSEEEASDRIDKAIMTKEAKILEEHSKFCGIWQSESDKRWRTKVPDASKCDGKRLIAKSTKADLEKSIIAHYESVYGVKQSLNTIYLDWLTSKMNSTTPNNARKLQYVWNKYYKGSSLAAIPLQDLTVGKIQDFLYAQLAKNYLTKKQYNEMKSVVNSMLDFAVAHEYIAKNKARDVVRPSDNKFKSSEKKPIEEIVYTTETRQSAIEEAEAMFNKTGNTAYLAICLNFTLGLRVGELVALETTDIKGNCIHISKEEIHETHVDADNVIHKCGVAVVPHTKTICGERVLPLTSDGIRYIGMALDYNKEHGFKDGNFIFLDNYGKRKRSDSIENALRRVNGTRNDRDGFDIVGRPSGNHAVRRTYISNLHENGLPDAVLKDVAGHKDFSTTQACYIFSTKQVDDYADIFAKALGCKGEKNIAK